MCNSVLVGFGSGLVAVTGFGLAILFLASPGSPPACSGRSADAAMIERRKPTTLDKLRVMVRQANCALCGKKLGALDDTQFDHEWALVNGGEDSLDNLRAVHVDCHKVKTHGNGATNRGSDRGEGGQDPPPGQPPPGRGGPHPRNAGGNHVHCCGAVVNFDVLAENRLFSE